MARKKISRNNAASQSNLASQTSHSPSKRSRSPTLAEQAERHHLYQLAVQSPQTDVALLQQIYHQARGRSARRLREDFCGTAALLCAWLRQGAAFSGEGIDIDAEPLAWGKQNNFKPLGKQGRRADLRVAEARAPSLVAPDIRCAFNFSYWIFRRREVLCEYFRAVYADLAADGVFVIDLHGGAEVFSEEEEVTDCGEFDLVCHQTAVSPVDHSANLALHFRFADGSEMHNAFQYTWRIWSMPEIMDVLREAGFDDLRAYWCCDEGEETRYELTERGYNDFAWVACLAAVK